MKNVSKLGLLALLVAFVGAFTVHYVNAQKTKSMAVKNSTNRNYVWIKYNCDPLNSQPTQTMEGNSSTIPYGSTICPGSFQYVCAVGLPEELTEPIPGDEFGNIRPLSNVNIYEYSVEYCE